MATEIKIVDLSLYNKDRKDHGPMLWVPSAAIFHVHCNSLLEMGVASTS
jgi:hypothetical protein